MENALRACVKGIRLGKILIHREGDDGREVKVRPCCGNLARMRIAFSQGLTWACFCRADVLDPVLNEDRRWV